MRAALFITCLDDTLFPEVGIATVRILERLGVEVEFPVEQTCCGQIRFNTGYGHELLPLVRRFADTFGDAPAIVTPSGSCAVMVVEQYARLARRLGDERLAVEVGLPLRTSESRRARSNGLYLSPSARRAEQRQTRPSPCSFLPVCSTNAP